LLLP
jgi:hypothetical protein